MSSISNKFVQMTLALFLALGFGISTIQPAEAGGRGGRLAAGIVLGVVGGAIIASEIRRSKRRHRRHRRARLRAYHYSRYQPRHVSCYRGPRQCRWVGRRECWYNRYDERVCSGGRYKCWRERICD